jgi:hypothetical protein
MEQLETGKVFLDNIFLAIVFFFMDVMRFINI